MMQITYLWSQIVPLWPPLKLGDPAATALSAQAKAVQWVCCQPVTFYANGSAVEFTIGLDALSTAQVGEVNVFATLSRYLTTP